MILVINRYIDSLWIPNPPGILAADNYSDLCPAGFLILLNFLKINGIRIIDEILQIGMKK